MSTASCRRQRHGGMPPADQPDGFPYGSALDEAMDTIARVLEEFN